MEALRGSNKTRTPAPCTELLISSNKHHHFDAINSSIVQVASYNGGLSGIAGFTHLQRRPDPTLIRRSVESIHHRGPDQNGVYESEVVSLGAVRLKIIDL